MTLLLLIDKSQCRTAAPPQCRLIAALVKKLSLKKIQKTFGFLFAYSYLCTEKMVECATIFAVEPIKTRRNGYSERPIRQ